MMIKPNNWKLRRLRVGLLICSMPTYSCLSITPYYGAPVKKHITRLTISMGYSTTEPSEFIYHVGYGEQITTVDNEQSSNAL